MPDQVKAERINALLQDVAQRYGVDILFAVESGSRAWGFASRDSDFDVRFIYREPLVEMLRLFPASNVIQEVCPLNEDGTGVPVDMVGWSLTKALHLGVASNPQLCEWMSSGESYQEAPEFRRRMLTLTNQSAPRVLAHHHRGLAKKTALDYLCGPKIPIAKKYLYSIRSTLAAQYMVEHPHVGACPPILFSDLRARVKVDDAVWWQIEDLLEFKQGGQDDRQRFPILDRWLAARQVELVEAIAAIPEHHVSQDIAERINLNYALPDLQPEFPETNL